MQLTLFNPDTFLSIRWRMFQNTELGRLHSSLPLEELAALLPKRRTQRGAQPWFDNCGKVALQFLKSYTGLSDERLLERINTDWAYQLFCGIQLDANEQIRDKDLIWQTRVWVSRHLDIEQAQPVLIQHWKPWMKDLHIGLTDATCYESYIKYPTDVKLLWDCIDWLHKQIKFFSKTLRIRRPRSRYKEQARKQQSYERLKKKPYKKRQSRRRQLLHLCGKLYVQLGDLLLMWTEEEGQEVDHRQHERYQTIGRIYEQQRYLHDHPGEQLPDRIVSLYKPYIRCIVRGKENKRVEFGAKVNTWQVDGLNFIEHFSYKPFNEGIRLKKGIAFHRRHFGKLRQVGADDIYANNANRRYCTRGQIATCFKPKGRRTANATLRQQEDQARKSIRRARGTILEGSYGNDKNHYGLRKVKARNEITEQAWIFFGMMTANAVKIAKRKRQPARAAPPSSVQDRAA